MSDNGSAMLSDEMVQGLSRLGVNHHTTLAESPEQNGKMEHLTQVEGRLMAMLEGEKNLTLELLNRATLAWLELEYNRKLHSEIGTTPLGRFLTGPTVLRPSPSSDIGRAAAGLSSAGDPNPTSQRRHADRWRSALRDPLALSHLAAPDGAVGQLGLIERRLGRRADRRGAHDAVAARQAGQADGRRRVLGVQPDLEPEPTTTGIAPLLRELMNDYAATGLPPAYVPLPTRPRRTTMNEPLLPFF
jgi:hypothetical protein